MMGVLRTPGKDAGARPEAVPGTAAGSAAVESTDISPEKKPRRGNVRVKDAGGSTPLARLVAGGAVALLLSALATLVLSARPLVAFTAFFTGPFVSAATFLSMIEQSAPLALAALGVAVAFRAGHYNLGGEGQLYAGALATAIAGLSFPAGAVGTIAALFAGMAGGMVVALPPTFAKRRYGADVLLVSILVSNGAIYIIDWAIGGPLRYGAGNLVAMSPLPAATLLPRLFPPSTMTPAPAVAASLCLAGWLYFERTRTGAMHDMAGRNPRFTVLHDWQVPALSWLPLTVSGAMHGLAGAMLVLGQRGTAIRGMSGGLGWSAIGVSLVAGSSPAAIPFAALLFAWLDAGSRQAAILADMPSDAALAIKALVILAISARPSFAALARPVARLAVRFSGRDDGTEHRS